MSIDWSTRLRSAGLRVTRPRLTVLEVVAAEPHIAADVVAQRARAELGAVSTQAVYDVLNILTHHAILRRFEPAGSAMRFETRTGDNHHHLVCRSCGQVADVPCAVGSMPCDVPAETDGFAVDEAEVTYWGLCPACQTSSTQDHDDHDHPTQKTSSPELTSTDHPTPRSTRSRGRSRK